MLMTVLRLECIPQSKVCRVVPSLDGWLSGQPADKCNSCLSPSVGYDA
jgi:hypothetical protein